MKMIQRILALIALVFMAAFIVAVICLTVSGTRQDHSYLVYGTLSGFLFFGLAALILRWADNKLKEKKQAETSQNASPEQ